MNLIALSAVFAICSASFVTESLQTYPAFVWGSEEYLLGTKQSGLQAQYQLSTPEGLAADVLGLVEGSGNSQSVLLNNTALQSSSPQLITVIILGELDRHDLATGQGLASKLSQTLEAAESSIYISDLQDAPQQLLQAVKAQSGAMVELGPCSADSQSSAIESLGSELRRHPGQLVVVICDSPSLPDQFGKVQEDLWESKRPFLVVYAGQPDSASERPAARSLMSTSSSNAQDLCDRKCRIQVRLFEVIILLIFLLMALWIGLSMLHILDTPTRFEQEKKEVNRHHD